MKTKANKVKNEIIQVLMDRDKMSKDEAEELLSDARESLDDGEDPEEILLDHFGLEPDYIFDLIP